MARRINLPKPKFQITKAPQRIRLAKPVLLLPTKHQGGVIASARRINLPKQTFQITKALKHIRLAKPGIN